MWKGFQENPKTTEEGEMRILGEWNPLASTDTMNVKHRIAPSQMRLKPQNKTYSP